MNKKFYASFFLYLPITAYFYFFTNYFNLVSNRVIYSRICFVLLALQICTGIFLYRTKTKPFFKNFFTEPSHPMNLAIIRILIFGYLLSMTSIENYTPYGKLANHLVIPPPGLDLILTYFPVSASNIKIFFNIFYISCFMSLIGLFSRTFTVLAAFSGLYILGLPQFFGKVSHTHHLIWFVIILATSRCGDALSVDFLIQAFKKGKEYCLRKASCYTVPIRFMWILMALIYFYSGFWKWWNGGIDWIFSNSLQNILYIKWVEVGLYWTPVFRIDHYPLLIHFSAFATVAFELLFIVLIFSVKTRLLAVIGGLTFHQMTYTFMRISFQSLQFCYLIFFDYYKIFQKIKSYFAKNQSDTVNPEPSIIHPSPSNSILTYVIGMILITGNLYCNVVNTHSWPFTSHALFAYLCPDAHVSNLEIIYTDESGRERIFSEYDIQSKFSTVKYRSVVFKILKTKNNAQQRKLILSLWQLIESFDPDYASARNIKVSHVLLDATPDILKKGPVKRDFMFEITKSPK